MDFNFIKLLVILIWSFQNVFSDESPPIVKTYSGPVKGFYRISMKNRTYKAFQNIPYAKPPVGNLRFEAPVPIDPWTDVLDATQEITECAQFDMLEKKVLGQEDCIYLNVYTPHTGEGRLFPVIFYIHGGGFQWGSSKYEGPKYFMDKDVIFVNMNYRLGPFGFLSTGDKYMPGNYGLKDQNMALLWVRDNIKFFGGDLNKITMLGCSAGGASVHYHYLSPMSRGLFRNGISSSGTALNPWAFARNPMNDTLKMAIYVNCPTTNSLSIANCLKKISARELGVAASKLLYSEYLSIDIDRTPFRPVVEYTKYDYFINRSPQEIIQRGEVYDAPWIVGVSTEEGIMLTRGVLLNQTRLDFVDEHWEEVSAYLMFLQDDVPSSRQGPVVKVARKHYMGNKPLKVDDYETLKKFIHLIGDKAFSFDSQKAAIMQAKVNKSPVYFYNYNYRAEQSYGDYLLGTTKIDFGVCHCDDVTLYIESEPVKITRPTDVAMLEIMIDMIYSVAESSNGEPKFVVDWPRVYPIHCILPLVHIGGPNKIYVNVTYNFAHQRFWHHIGF